MRAKILTVFMTGILLFTALFAGNNTVFAATYDNTPEQIVCTPHGDLRFQMGFAWVTAKNNSAAVVQVVEKAIGNFEDSSMKSFTGEAGDIDNWRWHKAVATGLAAGTTYQYRVGDGTIWSNTGEFTTAPDTEEPIEGGFTFLQANDPQASTLSEFTVWGDALARAAEKIPDYKFILFGGDHVDNGGSEDQWQWFWNSAQSTISKSIFAGATGNHDVYSGHRYSYRFNYEMPTNAPTTNGMYYSFDYANAHFIVINAQALSDNLQMDWIKYDFVKNARKWNIVLIHNPLYTNGDHYAEVNVRAAFNDMLNDTLGADIIFAGHDHLYNRTYPILNNEPIVNSPILTGQKVGNLNNVTLWDNPEGTVNQLNNAVGTKFYNLNANAETQWFWLLPINGELAYQPQSATFAGVTVTENELVNTAYYINGDNETKIESVGIKKDKPQINPPTNVQRTFENNTMRITWDAPEEQDGQAVQRYVVYDENNGYIMKNKTYFVEADGQREVSIAMNEATYNQTNFVVKAIGTHSVSEIGTTGGGEVTQPVDLTAMGGTGSITASWPTLSADTQGASLSISLDGNTWTPLSTTEIQSQDALSGAKLTNPITPASTQAVITGLTGNVQYWLKLTVTGGKNAGESVATAIPQSDETPEPENPGTALWIKDVKNSSGLSYSGLSGGILQGSYVTLVNNGTDPVNAVLAINLYDANGRLLRYQTLAAQSVAAGIESTISIPGYINTTGAQTLEILPYIETIDPARPGGAAYVLREKR